MAFLRKGIVRRLCFTILMWCSWLDGTECAPTFLVLAGSQRCLQVDAPQDTILKIFYEAPDVPMEANNKPTSETKSFLTLNVKPFDRVYETDLHHAPIRNRLKPLSHAINKKEGTLYHTMEVSGTATICIRVQTSGSERQSLAFGLRVTSSDEQPEIQKAAEIEKAKGGSKTINVDQHLSHMELELQRISKAMEIVLKEADQNRNRDEKFHQQALAMHSASTFWPIVQVCVLLITGFTQTTHIVQFFKSRRII